MRFLEIKTRVIIEIKERLKLKKKLTKCAIISHRWGDHELSFQ